MTDIIITLDASAIGGTIIPGGQEARKVVGSTGRINVKGIDAPSYLQAGAKFVNSKVISYGSITPPRAASAARIVASTALSNGTLSIANQPDVPRQLGIYVDPGAAAITGGDIAVTYTANDGTTQVDHITATAAASTPKTVTTSKGAISLTSVIVTGMAGGSSPKVQVNDTNSLSMTVPPNSAGFVIDRAFADGAVDGTTAVATSAASYTPSTAPNGTHTYNAIANLTAP